MRWNVYSFRVLNVWSDEAKWAKGAKEDERGNELTIRVGTSDGQAPRGITPTCG
jgi:hypothetical protein